MDAPAARFDRIYEECKHDRDHWCNNVCDQNISFLQATKIESNPSYYTRARRRDVDWSTTHANLNEDTYAHDCVDMGADEIRSLYKAWLVNKYSFNELDDT